MNQLVDFSYEAGKWVREPSSCTRVVVIATGISSDHIDLIHHGFSCFENIALMHLEVGRAGFSGLSGVKISGCYVCLVVAGELDKRFLNDLPMGEINIYQIEEGGRAERSVIAAVEQVKRLARMTHSRQLDIDTVTVVQQAWAC